MTTFFRIAGIDWSRSISEIQPQVKDTKKVSKNLKGEVLTIAARIGATPVSLIVSFPYLNPESKLALEQIFIDGTPVPVLHNMDFPGNMTANSGNPTMMSVIDFQVMLIKSLGSVIYSAKMTLSAEASTRSLLPTSTTMMTTLSSNIVVVGT